MSGWYVTRNGQTQGPLENEALAEMLRRGALDGADIRDSATNVSLNRRALEDFLRSQHPELNVQPEPGVRWRRFLAEELAPRLPALVVLFFLALCGVGACVMLRNCLTSASDDYAEEQKRKAEGQRQIDSWESQGQERLRAARPATLGEAIQVMGRAPDSCIRTKGARNKTAHWSRSDGRGAFGLVSLTVEDCLPSSKVLW